MAEPAIAPNDILKVDWFGRLHQQRTITSWYYRCVTQDVSNPTTGLGALAAQFDAVAMTLLKPLLTTESNNWFLRLRRLNPIPTSYFDFTTVNQAGTVATVSVPSSVSLTIQRRRALAGRVYQGRVYMPGIPQADTSASVLIAGKVNSWNVALAQILQQNITTGAWEFEPIHLQRHPILTPHDIDVARVDPILSNQRRRRVGRGE